VIEATQWLKQYVGGRAVGLYGVSRGAELALLVASHADFALVASVAVHAPTSVVVGGFDPLQPDTDTHQPAWVYKNTAIAQGTTIAIETYRGPIFISHGTRDEVWSVEESRKLEARLKRAGNSPEVLYLDGESHVLSREAGAKVDGAITAFFKKTLIH
jgi:dipeptidyl aminopeptidase/acylaminoacyl peptidase